MLATLLIRYHLRPALGRLLFAVRRGPVFFAVALFLAGTLVWQSSRGLPPVVLFPEPWVAGVVSLGLTAVLALGLSWPLVAQRGRWKMFFSPRPWGAKAWAFYAVGRALVSWLVGAVVVCLVCGPTGVLWILGGAVPFSVASVLVTSRTRHTPRGRRPRLPGMVGWWLSQPILHVAPLGLWALLMVWAVSGQAGFVWADHPVAGDALVDFGWPTVLGLLWVEAGAKVPWNYFRMARAPFHRVAVAVGGPVAAATLVAVLAVGLLASPGPATLRALVLTATGAAFWVAYWCRVGPSGAAVVVFLTLLVGGLAAERDWWGCWALGQIAVTAVLVNGWRTRYYEGDHRG